MTQTSFDFLIVSTLSGAISAGTPILLASLGEIFSEKSGVYNISIEGTMLVGALAGIVAAFVSGNLFLAVLAAGLAGLLMALVHAFFTVTLRANQIVCGFALVILGTGLSSFLGKPYVGERIVESGNLSLPILSDIPIIGEIFFQHNVMVYFSYVLVALSWCLLFRTRWGISIRAVGENPDAAQLMGVNVQKTRYLCVLASGFFAGLGGAYLSVIDTQMWVEHMTAGRGWIAVALVIFSGWGPVKALLGAYLFGMMISLQFRLQTIGIDISAHLMSMLPYVITILALIISYKKNRSKHGMPASIGKPFMPQS